MNLRKSFTLVELLIAVCIFSIIAGALGATLFSALKLWQRARATGYSQTNILLTIESLSRDLRQSFILAEVDFKGNKEEIEFATIIGDEIYKLNYSFSSIKGFTVEKTKHKDIVAKKDNIDSEIILFKAKTIKFSYFIFDDKELQYQWRDSFDQEDKVPLAVKVVVEQGERRFEKIIFIPTYKK